MATLLSPPEGQLDRACQELDIPVSRFQEDVQRIKAWMQSQPHLPEPHELDGLLYENMLLRCKGSVEVAKQAIDLYFSQRMAVPEFFTNRDPLRPALQTSFLDLARATILKDLTPEGYRVLCYQVKDAEDYSAYNLDEATKWWFLHEDIILKEDLNMGMVYIHDLKHLTMAIILKGTPTFIHKATVCCLNGYKARVKGIHLVNPTPIVEVILSMARKLLPKKLVSRLHVHADMESLHQHVERDILPVNFGGVKGTFEDLADAWVKDIQSGRDWILQNDARWKVDESKRLGKSFNFNDVFGIEGTFKQLNVD